MYNFTVLVHVFDFNKEIQTIELRVSGRGILGSGAATNRTNRPVIGQRNATS